jgi:phage tail-like protein
MHGHVPVPRKLELDQHKIGGVNTMNKFLLASTIIIGSFLPTQVMAKQEGDANYTCALELAGVAAGYFTECSGLGSENEVVEHKVVNEHGVEVVLKLPGRLRFGDLVLKRGITTSLDMWTWRQMVVDGDVSGARQDGSLVLYDQNSSEIARWNFEDAWPSKMRGSSGGIEEVTIVYSDIVRVN